MENNKRVTDNLRSAIQTMRDACDDAERRMEQSPAEEAPRHVLHALAWGFANASSGIEGAMSALELEHAMSAAKNG